MCRPRCRLRQSCKPTARGERFLTSPDARLLVCLVTTDLTRNVLGRATLFPSAEHEVDRLVRQRMHRRRLRRPVAAVSGPLNAFGKRSRARSLGRALNGLKNPGEVRHSAHRPSVPRLGLVTSLNRSLSAHFSNRDECMVCASRNGVPLSLDVRAVQHNRANK